MPTIIIKPRKSSASIFRNRIEPLREGKPVAVAVVAYPVILDKLADLANLADQAKVVMQVLLVHPANHRDPFVKIPLQPPATFVHLANLEELVHPDLKEMLVNLAPMAMLAKTVNQELKVLPVHLVHPVPLETMVLKARLVLHQS